MRRLISVVIVTLSIWGGGDASAQEARCDDAVVPEAKRDAEELTLLGVACFREKDYGRALGFYRSAFAASSSKEALLEGAIGRTMDELGLWSTARSYYRRYLRHEKSDSDGRRKIAERLKDLEREIDDRGAKITLRGDPTKTYVYMQLEDGHRESLGATPMSFVVAPGDYTLVFEKRGYYTRIQRVAVRDGQKTTISARLVSTDSTFDANALELQRTGVMTMGVSVPIIAAGVGLALWGQQDLNEARDLGQGQLNDRFEQRRVDLISSGNITQRVGLVTVVVGTATLFTGAGIALVGFNANKDDEADATLRVGPGSASVHIKF